MTKPKVTVCVQAYRHAAYIGRCLDSILAQKTDYDFEIVLGEDDSDDGTREICQTYAKRRPDVIRLFLRDRKDNIKIYGKPTGRHNFVENLRAARGRYVALCDGDDYWSDPQKLQKQTDYLDAHPAVGICFTHADIDNGKTRYADYRAKKLHRFDIFDSLRAKQGLTLTMMYRRALLDVDKFKRASLQCAMGDWPLECMIVLNAGGCRLPDTTAVYNKHDQGATALRMRGNTVSYDSRIDFCQKILDLGLSTDEEVIRGVKRFQAEVRLLKGSVLFGTGSGKAGLADMIRGAAVLMKLPAGSVNRQRGYAEPWKAALKNVSGLVIKKNRPF